MLSRISPTHDIVSLREAMNRLFDDTFSPVMEGERIALGPGRDAQGVLEIAVIQGTHIQRQSAMELPVRITCIWSKSTPNPRCC